MSTVKSKPPVFVFSGPSGAGKSTLLKWIMDKFPNCFSFSVSHTTRKIRPGEENGVDYYFTDIETIKKDIAEGKFIEHAEFAGNIYGTSKLAVQQVLDSGKICILDVDLAGVRSIYSLKPSLDAKYILILPPSMDALEKRLRERGTETEDSLARRLMRAKNDVAFAHSAEGKSLFDCIILNNNLDDSYKELENFMQPSIQALKQ